jgi:hypothetical protein
MIYSKYSDYKPEQIINRDYKKLCDLLLCMVKDEQIKAKMERNII